MNDFEWIDDAIDRWHDSEFISSQPLHEYLGMTWDQYAFYVENNDKILPEGWVRPSGN